MAESISRALRDGALEGEHAPALTIKDTLHNPFGFDTFTHLLCNLAINILSAKSQSQCLVLVAFERSPSFYHSLLKSRGIDIKTLKNWLRILDCYSDPLGWKDGNAELVTNEVEKICKNVKDLDKLLSSILELGKGVVGQGKVRFSVAIDSVSVMLRHASVSSLASLINNLRSTGQVSSLFWLIHSDLHEARATGVVEYMSSMVASLDPINQSANIPSKSENLFSLESNSGKGKFNVRLKRRNGRVKVMSEEFHMEQSGIKFKAISSIDGIVNQTLMPKVQFNLQLSEKERADRENVVLPFEHQGNGKDVNIYDGRRSLSAGQNGPKTVDIDSEMKNNINTGKGEIHYFRDSDDELPDSDEDPDDDLDI